MIADLSSRMGSVTDRALPQYVFANVSPIFFKHVGVFPLLATDCAVENSRKKAYRQLIVRLFSQIFEAVVKIKMKCFMEW